MTEEEFNKFVDYHKRNWEKLGIEAHHPNCLCVHCVEGYRISTHPNYCGCIHCTGCFSKRATDHPFFDLIDKLLLAQNNLEALEIELKMNKEKVIILENRLKQ